MEISFCASAIVPQGTACCYALDDCLVRCWILRRRLVSLDRVVWESNSRETIGNVLRLTAGHNLSQITVERWFIRG